MNRLLGALALVGFMAAAVVHTLALRGIDVADRVPGVWLLHVGIFAVFGPFVFSSKKVLGSRPSTVDLLSLVPRWVAITTLIVFVYAFLNFFVFMARTEMGNPSYENGRYVLMNHGHLIREITPAEYATFRANELRGFSGHWLLFYFVPFAYFIFAKGQDKSPVTNAPRGQ